MKELWTYDGRRAVVSGGASGMGDATARLLREAGAEVIVLDVKEPAASVDGYIHTDLRDPGSIEAAVERLGSRVDALFNCAGLPHGQGFPPAQTVTVNFLGLRHLTGCVIPLMPPGSAIASIVTLLMGWWDPPPAVLEFIAIEDFRAAQVWCESHPAEIANGYGFSKICLSSWTLRQVVALAARGIRINCIGPGPTTTPMMPHFVEAHGEENWQNLPRPLLRNSTAEEQAHPMVFLNSPAASFISGAMLQTDGGMMAARLTGALPLALEPMGTIPESASQ